MDVQNREEGEAAGLAASGPFGSRSCVNNVPLTGATRLKADGKLTAIPCHRVGRLKARDTERRIRQKAGEGRLTTSLGRSN